MTWREYLTEKFLVAFTYVLLAAIFYCVTHWPRTDPLFFRQ